MSVVPLKTTAWLPGRPGRAYQVQVLAVRSDGQEFLITGEDGRARWESAAHVFFDEGAARWPAA